MERIVQFMKESHDISYKDYKQARDELDAIKAKDTTK
jgi:hypothetical protein